ncbi:MAG TPA: transporter [Flavobacterium sp.]|jgi:hypothetical protein
MLQPKYVLLLLGLLSTPLSYCQFTDVINSNRPGESQSAFSVGLSVIQAELGFYAIQEEHEHLQYESAGVGSDLSIRYGAFFNELEVMLDLQYQSDVMKTGSQSFRRAAFKQTTVGAKYLLFDPAKRPERKPDLKSWKANHRFSWKNFIPAVAVYAGLNINLSNNEFSFPLDPKFTPKFMLMTQNQFGKWVLVTNIISDKMTTNYPTLGYVVTVTRGFNDRWSAFVENQGFQSDFYADGIVRGGAAWLLKENIQLDASIGTSLKTTPSQLAGGMGISWRFDDNYEEVLHRLPGDDSKKKKGDKDAKKGKKRKDQVETEETDLP